MIVETRVLDGLATRCRSNAAMCEDERIPRAMRLVEERIAEALRAQ